MPWLRILNVPALCDLVWEKWPALGTNQFWAKSKDRIRMETQNRLPSYDYQVSGGRQHGSSAHLHEGADTVHIIMEGEGEYTVAPGVWVPARAGDIFLTHAGEPHGGRGTSEEKPFRYVVLEGPTPETLTMMDGGMPANLNWGLADVDPNDKTIRIGYNGGVAGTKILMGGPDEKPEWVDMLPKEEQTRAG